DSLPWQAQLASVHDNLGALCSDTGRLRRADAAYRLALRVREGIERRFPDDLDHRVYLAGTLCNTGHVARRRGHRDEALALYERSIHLLESAREAPAAGALVAGLLRRAREGGEQTLSPPPRLRVTHL